MIFLINAIFLGIIFIFSILQLPFQAWVVGFLSSFMGMLNFLIFLKRRYQKVEGDSLSAAELSSLQKEVMSDLDDELQRRKKENVFLRN